MISTLIEDIASAGSLYLSSPVDTARQELVQAATSLIHHLEAPPETLARIGWEEPSRTAALQTAFELGILQQLKEDEPKGSKDLAKGTKADPDLVARTLKHLAANDLIKESGPDSYLPTPFSLAASSDPTLSAGLTYSFSAMIPVFQRLPSYLSSTNYQPPTDSGPVQHGLQTEKSFFEILGSDERLGGAFNKFMEGYAKARPRWVDIYPVKERLLGKVDTEGKEPVVVDVGGGLGHELQALQEQLSPDELQSLNGRLVLQDVPAVIDQAKQSAHLHGSITALAHDFFTPQPKSCLNAQVYFLRLILHDWSDEKCVTILSHLREAMRGKTGSRLLINETVLKDVGAPREQTSLDWTMMGMLGSKERTEAQWRELLGNAGLEVSGTWHMGRESVMEAVVRDA